jgi:hypothetical protein
MLDNVAISGLARCRVISLRISYASWGNQFSTECFASDNRDMAAAGPCLNRFLNPSINVVDTAGDIRGPVRCQERD